MKELFLKATIAMALMGMALLSISFFSSMNPSKKVLSERSQHNISSIEKGSYRTDYFKEDQDTRIMIIHDWDGTFFTHLLPLKAGKVLMPDNYWAEYRSEYHCNDFRPQLNSSAQIKKEGLIVVMMNWFLLGQERAGCGNTMGKSIVKNHRGYPT